MAVGTCLAAGTYYVRKKMKKNAGSQPNQRPPSPSPDPNGACAAIATPQHALIYEWLRGRAHGKFHPKSLIIRPVPRKSSLTAVGRVQGEDNRLPLLVSPDAVDPAAASQYVELVAVPQGVPPPQPVSFPQPPTPSPRKKKYRKSKAVSALNSSAGIVNSLAGSMDKLGGAVLFSLAFLCCFLTVFASLRGPQ